MNIETNTIVNPGEAKTPRPFLPAWRVKLGPVVEHGEGLLPNGIWRNLDHIDEFSVLFGDWTLKLHMPLGRCVIMEDSHIVHAHDYPHDVKPRLIWFRRMRKDFASYDTNSDSFQCLLYGVGYQVTVNEKNYKFGFTIRNDRKVYEGLP
jgi:hypothetical protein